MKNYIFLVMIAVLFAMPLVNAADNITMTAVDELNGMPQSWQVQVIYISNNLSAVNVVAYRAGLACLYDGDESTACITSVNTAGCAGSDSPQNKTTFQAFGYNSANFKLVWSVAYTSGATGRIYIYLENGTIAYDSGNQAAGSYTTYVNINNTNGALPKAQNITLYVKGDCTGSGGNTETTTVKEFILYNNSAGYTYADDKTITMPSTLLTGYSQVVVQQRGQETYNPSYTQTRNYYLTTSQLANYSFKGYLLADTAGYIQPFTILNGNGQGISGSLITIGRWHGGIENTLVQCQTGPSGQCSTWLQSNQPLYSTKITANGFNTYYNQTTPYLSSSGTSIVYLTNNVPVNFQTPFAGITSYILPTDQYINNATTNSSCQVIATLGNLNYINYTVVVNNFTTNSTIYASNYTNSNPSGATLKLPLNTNGRFQLNCFYEWVSNVSGNATTYQNSNTMTLWIYNSNMGNAASAGMNPWFGIIISLGVILIVCAPIAIISPTYGMITGVFLMLMFASVGMMPDTCLYGCTGATPTIINGWYLSGLSILTAIALLIIKNFS